MRGFTLVEVLVVAIIIAVLASVGITAAFNARKSATESTITAIVSEVNQAMQRASLLPEDEEIPFPSGMSASNACTAIQTAIERLALSTITTTNGIVTVTPTTVENAGTNATPVFTYESARKMYELMGRHFQTTGASKTGDNRVKYDLVCTSDGTWGGTQFRLKNATSE